MISNVSAGKLNYQITLLRPTKTLSGAGAHSITYESAGTVWANLKQISLREAMSSNVELQTETYTVLMRYRSGIGQDWCVQMPNGMRYRIASINADKLSGMMILGVELDNTIIQRVES